MYKYYLYWMWCFHVTQFSLSSLSDQWNFAAPPPTYAVPLEKVQQTGSDYHHSVLNKRIITVTHFSIQQYTICVPLFPVRNVLCETAFMWQQYRIPKMCFIYWLCSQRKMIMTDWLGGKNQSIILLPYLCLFCLFVRFSST